MAISPIKLMRTGSCCKTIVRMKEVDMYAKARGRTSRHDYKVRDHVYIQDICTKNWDIRGKVVEARPASDGSSPRSFLVEGDLGGPTSDIQASYTLQLLRNH